MKIGIIGTGRMGSGLGKLWADKGHEICFGSRSPEKAKALDFIVGSKMGGGSIPDAINFGDVVLLGTPWSAAEEMLKSLPAGIWTNKVLIDITNPFNEGGGLALGFTTSAAEQIAGWASGARVVKAFNGIHWRILNKPDFNGTRADVYYCGDDASAKAMVKGLIGDLGFEPVDAGPLSMARTLEPMVQLWARLAFAQGYGTESAFKLLRR